LERGAESENEFTTLTMAVPVEFAGAKVELAGFLRTEDVKGFVGLWMRQDGDAPALAFDNMQDRQLSGTTEWAEYSISMPIHSDAKQLFLAARGGSGFAGKIGDRHEFPPGPVFLFQ